MPTVLVITQETGEASRQGGMDLLRTGRNRGSLHFRGYSMSASGLDAQGSRFQESRASVRCHRHVHQKFCIAFGSNW